MIRLQFVREAALSSQMIAWFSHGAGFSHVDALLPNGQLIGARSDRAGGRPSGVHLRGPGYHPFVHQVIMAVPATKDQQVRFRAFLDQQIGKPYDRWAIWGFILDRDWREADSWICSELQAAALEYAGVLPRLYLEANRLTPRDVALAISAVGATVITIK